MKLDLKRFSLPFRIRLNLDSKTYQLSFKHFKSSDSIYLDLFDDNGNLLVLNEKLRYGIPLFYYLSKDENGNRNLNLPTSIIVPFSNDKKEKKVNLENFNNNISLYVWEGV